MLTITSRFWTGKFVLYAKYATPFHIKANFFRLKVQSVKFEVIALFFTSVKVYHATF